MGLVIKFLLLFMHGILLDRYGYNNDQLYISVAICIQEEYSAAHQCFITENSLYVLCWRASDGEQGIHELKDWLLTIKV